ncbi:serine O-acetyltransferase [Enterococcus sp. LJL128]
MKNVYRWYSFSHYLYKKKLMIPAKVMTLLIRFIFGCFIPYSAQIGKGTIFGYGGIGVVIHTRSVIGENCIIDQCVTVGGKNLEENVPRVGNNVYIGAGAKILGDIKIGNNVVIGANAVVTKNIPDSCVVAGVPGRIIKENIELSDYRRNVEF